MDPVEHAHALVAVARQHEVTDDDAPLELPVRRKLQGAYFLVHARDGLRRDGKVVGRQRVLACARLVGVLEVRQEDVDRAAQGLDGLLRLIGTRVVDDGQMEALLSGHMQRVQDLGHVMRRRHEVERRRAARLLL